MLDCNMISELNFIIFKKQVSNIFFIHRNNATQEGCELFLTVLEAKDLISHEATDGMDTFVRIYLVPDEKPNYGPLQTKVSANLFFI